MTTQKAIVHVTTDKKGNVIDVISPYWADDSKQVFNRLFKGFGNAYLNK